MQNLRSSTPDAAATQLRRRQQLSALQVNSDPSRTIEWLGCVNYGNLDKVLLAMKTSLSHSDEEIHLIVSSPGGATGIAMSFLDTCRYVLRPNLTTIGSGDVDSSGIIIFLAGKRRFLTPNTTLLLHLAGRIFDSDRRFSTADVAAMLKEDSLKDYQYACTISETTNGKLSTQQVLELMKKNTILTPDEAVRLGIADAVLRA